MKTISILALCALLSACKPLDGANPLDTPATYMKPPEAIGRFGPHANFYYGYP